MWTIAKNQSAKGRHSTPLSFPLRRRKGSPKRRRYPDFLAQIMNKQTSSRGKNSTPTWCVKTMSGDGPAAAVMVDGSGPVSTDAAEYVRRRRSKSRETMKLRLRRRKHHNSGSQISSSPLLRDQGRQSETWEPIQQQQQKYLPNSNTLGLEIVASQAFLTKVDNNNNNNDDEVELFPIIALNETNKVGRTTSIVSNSNNEADKNPTSVFSRETKTTATPTPPSSLQAVKIVPSIRDSTVSALQQKRQKMILMRRRLVGGGGGGDKNTNSSGDNKKGDDNNGGGSGNDGGVMKPTTTTTNEENIPSAVIIDDKTRQDPNLSTITIATDEESSCSTTTVDKTTLVEECDLTTTPTTKAMRRRSTTPADIKEWVATRNTVALSSSLFEEVDASVEVASVELSNITHSSSATLSDSNSICINDDDNNPTPRSRSTKISDYFCIPTVSSSDIHQVTNKTLVVGKSSSSESPTGIAEFPVAHGKAETKRNVDDATCDSDDTEKTTNTKAALGGKVVDSDGEVNAGGGIESRNYVPPDGGCTDIFDDIAKFFTCQFGNTKDIPEVVAEEGDYYMSLELEGNQEREEEGDANSTILEETNSQAEGIKPRELFDATWFESPLQLKDDFCVNDSSSVGEEASVELCLLSVDDRNLKSKNSWETSTSKQSRSTSQSNLSMSTMARNLLKTVGGMRLASKDTESNTAENMSPPEIQRYHHQSDDIFNTHIQSQDEISYGSLTAFDDDTLDYSTVVSSSYQVDEFPCDETASAATTISKEETILSKETDAMSFRSEESNPTWFDKCVEGGCTFAPADDKNYEDYSYTSVESALRTHYIESRDCIVARDKMLYPAISTNTASLHERSRANRYQKRRSRGTTRRYDCGLDSYLTDGTDRTGLTDRTDRTGLTDGTDKTDNDLLASCLIDGTINDNGISTVSSSRSSDFTPLESRNEELYMYDTASVHSESIMSYARKTPRIGSGIKRTGSRICSLAQSLLPYGRSSDSVREVDSVR